MNMANHLEARINGKRDELTVKLNSVIETLTALRDGMPTGKLNRLELPDMTDINRLYVQIVTLESI
jgi:hypothetical protein